MTYTALEDFTNWAQNFWDNLVKFFQGDTSYSFDVPSRIIVAIVIIILGWLVAKLMKLILRKSLGIKPNMYVVKKINGKKTREQVNSEATARGFVIPLVSIIHWIIVALIVLAVLGVQLSSTTGIISAVTVALGLALQDVIGCFASGLIVLATKPISIGEYVSIKNDYGQCEGTVMKVGVMMTELATFDGHYVYIPNSNIQKSIVTNINRDPDRRLDIAIGVSYDSDIELVKNTLLNIGNNDPRVLKDRGVQAPITNFQDSAIEFTLRVWTKDEDYWQTKFDFNERILTEFRKAGINIPYNILTVVKGDSGNGSDDKN